MNSSFNQIHYNNLSRLFGLIDQRPFIKLVANLIFNLIIILAIVGLIALIIFGLYYACVISKQETILNNNSSLDNAERGLLFNISTRHFSLELKSKPKISTNEFTNLIEKQKLYTIENWAPKDHLYIYHYTSHESAKLILQNESIKPFRSMFGTGIYFTHLPPINSDEILLRNNYCGDLRYSSKLECAFAFKRKDLKLIKQIDAVPHLNYSRDIWKSTQEINLKQFDYKFILRK